MSVFSSKLLYSLILWLVTRKNLVSNLQKYSFMSWLRSEIICDWKQHACFHLNVLHALHRAQQWHRINYPSANLKTDFWVNCHSKYSSCCVLSQPFPMSHVHKRVLFARSFLMRTILIERGNHVLLIWFTAITCSMSEIIPSIPHQLIW
jgi:hypothetical protein